MQKNTLLATILALGLLSSGSVLAAPAKAESEVGCPALREEKSYKGTYEDLKYLLPGKDGWVYRSQNDLRTDYSFRHENGDLLVKLSKALKDKGVELVIVYPPTRGVVAHQFVPRRDPLAKLYDPAKVRMEYKKTLADMNEQGVHMIGTPDTKLGSKFFFKADHHWTPEGAAEMAQLVADYVKALPLYAGLKKTQYVTKELPPVDNEPTFNAAIKSICGKGVPFDKLTLTETEPVEKGDAASLLGDANAEIVLVGTSNSKRAENELNFSGRLKEFLSADVLNAAISGSGVTESLVTYLASSHYKQTPPKVIIWEIPGYYDLDGGTIRFSLRQLIASTNRACEKPLAETKGTKLSGKVSDILNGKAKDLVMKAPYFGLKLNQKVEKEFKLVFNFDKGAPEVFEVKQSRSYPEDLSFYYAPRIPVGSRLVSVGVEGASGAVADATLCELPATTK